VALSGLDLIPKVFHIRRADHNWQAAHDVDRDTVLRAVEMLRDEGLVFTVPRRGTYVSPDAK